MRGESKLVVRGVEWKDAEEWYAALHRKRRHKLRGDARTARRFATGTFAENAQRHGWQRFDVDSRSDGRAASGGDRDGRGALRDY